MKISEDTNDTEMKEQAKVNFGMANGSLKWNNHVTGILQQIDDQNEEADAADEASEQNQKVDEAPVEDEEDNN